MSKLDLSIVIPAYKEAENIKSGTLKEVWDYMKNQNYSWEVLVVNDGSPDNTAKLTKEFIKDNKGFKLLNEPHRGKAGTVIAGMLKAKGNIILFTDMDQATPINQLEKVLPKFNEGYGIVIGSRTGRKGASLIRKIMAVSFMILRTIILRLPFKDTQCGFKAFTKEASQKVFSHMKKYLETIDENRAAVFAGFDLEFLYIARKLNLKIAEVPVFWEERGIRDEVNPIKDSIDGLRGMLAVRLNALRGKYKI